MGPVLALITAKDLSMAIQIANDTPFALTGGLYSRSPQNIERVRSEFLVGNLYINRSITGAIVGTTSIRRIQNVRRRNESRWNGLPAQFHVSARRHRKHSPPRLRTGDADGSGIVKQNVIHLSILQLL